MKTFTNLINESNCGCSQLTLSNGVTNHLTPVENIVTNVKNLFCAMLGIVAVVGEDGVSVKLHSSQFVSEKSVYDRLYQVMYNSQSLYSYITQQGLDKCNLVNLGQYFVVYFSPSDMPNATAAKDAEKTQVCKACQEMLDMNIDEAELSFINESEDDEEIENIRLKQISEIITLKDKVKAAKQFAAIVATHMSLPIEYYFTGVKSKDGDESIALRWRYIKRRPHGKSSESVRSLLNIFGLGKDAVWVGDFDKDAMFQLPDETRILIENILEILGAEKTSDPCVYKIDDEETKESDKKAKEEEDKKVKDEEDDKTEDDKSRGDESDNLLGDESSEKKDKKEDSSL